MNNRPQKYRSQIRIFADILDAVGRKRGEAKSTNILYAANLSHDRLVKYLRQLKEKQLIDERYDSDKTIYVLTDKGIEFLREFRKISGFAQAFGFEI